ncbi:hypothetical protein AKJ40_00790 [candidate division MSBL1 archaeon SCGC-AAA259M10]|uniref:Uncharacterized protein n=2 Tax=candidate division MSBL1 TaxID=215777 RepID=A0A133U867_9EURY|nr:hypothetical protein AKJ61_00875 [candidate division MSBL1 archaeon SCGC-AAA259B11]KXB00729.1 hypothetical protein AKJ40_00790 [candidate division MSBL1 archaeon SCGC-AAA259M10]
MSDEEMKSIDEILQDEENPFNKLKTRLRLKFSSWKLIKMCQKWCLQCAGHWDNSDEINRYFFFSGAEREKAEELVERIQNTVERSRKIQIGKYRSDLEKDGRVPSGRTEALLKKAEANPYFTPHFLNDEAGVELTMSEVLILARNVCRVRTLDKRTDVFEDKLKEPARERLEKLWNRLLLVPKRKTASQKAYLKRFGIEKDWEASDFREPKFHGRSLFGEYYEEENK